VTETKLANTLKMGAVSLWVNDLDLMIKFYRDAVGLDLISEQNGTAILGYQNNPIVVLEHKPAMKHGSDTNAPNTKRNRSLVRPN